ncbi:cyclic GMP-AMP synthase-like receptor [Anthonomus grandis grandis]|uniref:cyclic GMP-AMP synthase-like receptor n=1 Tax=Anthonomus grandis grandis TaxID=2921223 RepID=UPI002165AAB0|nr:cyclic GMP-AMP synthase-like receptor [Anthonomus grandis grandis]
MNSSSYKELEEPLKLIHKKFVSLDEREVRETKPLVRQVLVLLVTYMKEADDIFRELFYGLYFGGSFYHNLKIQNPDEFDIDFLLALPKCSECKILNCKCVEVEPGHVAGFLKFSLKRRFSPKFYEKFCLKGKVQSNLVFNWIKSLVCKALYRFKTEKHRIGTNDFWAVTPTTEISLYTECQPAVKICIKKGQKIIYADLAAAFRLDEHYWPGKSKSNSGFRSNPTNVKQFSIVPFCPKGCNGYWRPSFQAQEKLIISGKQTLKPALRLVKIMKSNLNHSVSSYVLKTLILQEADTFDWKNVCISDAFMFLLKKYVQCLKQGRVEYYWHKDVNLLDYMKKTTITNHCNEVVKLYLKIENGSKLNPLVAAEVILKQSSDYQIFITEWMIWKSQLYKKQISYIENKGVSSVGKQQFDGLRNVLDFFVTMANKKTLLV